MDFQLPLPIRLAAASSPHEETATPETPDSPPELRPGPRYYSVGDALGPGPHVAESSAAGAGAGAGADVGSSSALVSLGPDLQAQQAVGNGPAPFTHQFWLKDSKVAEELFTLHRSAQHLVDFAASIMGDHNPVTGDHRPVAVISDGDVTFMTQLSSDIVRSINRITNIRQHGTRMQTRKRRVKHGRANTDASPPLIRNSSVRMRSRTSREVTPLSGSKHTRKSTDLGDQLQQCYKCGRKETPEWRKGPDGLLCNSCGLVYLKQKRKQKAPEKERSK